MLRGQPNLAFTLCEDGRVAGGPQESRLLYCRNRPSRGLIRGVRKGTWVGLGSDGSVRSTWRTDQRSSQGDASSVNFAVRKFQRPPAVTLESSFCEVKEESSFKGNARPIVSCD